MNLTRKLCIAAAAVIGLAVLTPPVTASAVTAPSVSWAPPSGYANYPVKNVTSTGQNSVSGGGGDMRIVLPKDREVGPIKISSCRNVVLIGGQIKVRASQTDPNGDDQRAVYISGCTGVVHIEGLRIVGNVAGATSDAFAVKAPSATVQLENIRVDGIQGSDANHADCFQPWGGVKEYRIDRFTCSSNYQGLHVGVDLGAIGKGTIRRTNIYSSGGSGAGGYYFWGPRNPDPAKHYELALETVYVSGRSGDGVNRVIMPNSSDATCPAHVNGNLVTWRTSKCSWLGGVLTFGKPSTDFVPLGVAGWGYVPGGYAAP